MLARLRRVMAVGIAGLGVLAPCASSALSVPHDSPFPSQVLFVPRVRLMPPAFCRTGWCAATERGKASECTRCAKLRLMPAQTCLQCSGPTGCSKCRGFHIIPPKQPRKVPPPSPSTPAATALTPTPSTSRSSSLAPPSYGTFTTTPCPTWTNSTAPTAIGDATSTPSPTPAGTPPTAPPSVLAPTSRPPPAPTISEATTHHPPSVTTAVPTTAPPPPPRPTEVAPLPTSRTTPSPTLVDTDGEFPDESDEPSDPNDPTSPRRTRSPRRSTTPPPSLTPSSPPSNTAAAANQSATSSTEPSTLSGGAIAGIAIGAVAVCFGVVGLVVWKKKRAHDVAYREMLLTDHTTGSGQYLAML